MDSILSPNVMQEIHKYAEKKLKEDAPTFIVQVKKVESEKRRYWLVLLDGTGKEILAMFSKLLTQRIPFQDLILEPVIKINHYYLHQFKAEDFLENPPEAYVNIIGISDIEILSAKTLKKMVKQANNSNNKVGTSKSLRKQIQPLMVSPSKRESEPETDSTEEARSDTKALENENQNQAVDAMIEIENAKVDKLPEHLLSESEKYKINIDPTTKVTVYHNTKCVYTPPSNNTPVNNTTLVSQLPSNVIPVKFSTTNDSPKCYPLLRAIKESCGTSPRVDAIGELIFISRLFDRSSGTRKVKCKNLRIQDESGSALVSLWESNAEQFSFLIGSIVLVKAVRPKIFENDLELIVDSFSKVSIADDIDKTRIQQCYRKNRNKTNLFQ